MLLKHYLVWMVIGTLISGVALILVLNYINPEGAGQIGLGLFYISVFLSIGGTMTLLGFVWRWWRHREEVLFRQVAASFRQGILLAVVVAVTLLLQANRLLTWWNLLALVGGLSLLEYILLTVKRTPSNFN
ncbi:MAG: hypothetical protein WC621_01685 [Patescibacteria group bacterium]